jgi:predicted nucleotidyltransferase
MESADPISQLSENLGETWPSIMQARQNARDKRQQFADALKRYDSEDSSIVVYGSLARDEFTSKSDVDWTLLVDGIALPEHNDVALEIARLIKDEEKPPGKEGTFGGLTFSNDLIHRIGGSDDANRNTTHRILLLLESAALGRRDARDRVIKGILSRYGHEDYGLIYSAGPSNVPRFLQNDIARYWRTVAVDFAYKQHQRGEKGWALRVAKLRISRKLTYVSGLLMCFSCEFEKTEGLLAAASDPQSKLHAFVEHLTKYTNRTPLEVVARTVLQYPELQEIARTLFKVYDQFLGILNDETKREYLEKLPREKVSGDTVYESVRSLSHDFQASLDAMFFDENGTDLPRLTKIYGVF